MILPPEEVARFFGSTIIRGRIKIENESYNLIGVNLLEWLNIAWKIARF